MEDYKILIYIVLSILYFLFKGRGKKKKPVTRRKAQPQQAEQDSSGKKKPKSFEELLAELSGENREEEERTSQSSGEGEILSESEEIKPLSEQVDERPIHQEVSQEEYENADETLKELYKKGERLKSIDELVDIEKVSAKSDRFREFERENEENVFAKEIREGLSNPDSAKKAIVYAEIFNRKY